MRIGLAFGIAMLVSLPALGRAERLAVVALELPAHPAPATNADRLAADLVARGYRVVPNAEVSRRLAAGNQNAGPDWAADEIQSIAIARTALARLDRAFAVRAAARIAQAIAERGGGAGGSEVLVEWAMLERALAGAASDVAGAKRWLDFAVAFDPAVELNPLNHPAEERDQFANRRLALRTELPATITVSTTPPAAEVWIDGVRRCASPCTVTVVPGRHLGHISAPAYAPASFDINLGPGAGATRQIALNSAYTGSSTQAIAAMLSDPSRRAEGESALESIGRFLDVDHVIALLSEGDDDIRVSVAPPPPGRARWGPRATEKTLTSSTLEQLRPMESPSGEESASPWYKKRGVWIGATGVVAAVLGGLLIYEAARPASTGRVTVVSQ